MASRAFVGFRRAVVEEGGETRDIFKWLLMGWWGGVVRKQKWSVF